MRSSTFHEDSPENRSPIEHTNKTEVNNYQAYLKDDAVQEQSSDSESDVEEIADSDETCLNGCQDLEA